jgi:hypothetical protein
MGRISKDEEHGLNAVAKIAGVSRGTVVAARGDLAGEARKQARKRGKQQTTAKPRERATQFLLNALALIASPCEAGGRAGAVGGARSLRRLGQQPKQY